MRTSSPSADGLAPERDPVVVTELTKTYPGPVEAVRGLSFRVRAGEIFGLLGPNGAGKTTTVGVLTTLVRPTSGEARVGGHDVRTDPLAVRGSIGVVFQDSVLDNDFSGAQNLRLHARLRRVPDAERRIASLLAAVGLTERAGDVVSTYSGGMRRRLEIARALLADPKVMFLDEPTLGLDPIARRDLWQVVRTLRERHGVTIVLSTHYLEEAQDVCDRVAIVDRGRIVEEGRPSELVDRLGHEVADLALAGDHDATELLAALDGRARHVIQGGSGVSIVSTEPRGQLADRIGSLPLAELGVMTMTVRPTTLNDVFLHLTASAPEHDLAAAAGELGMSAAAGFVPLYRRRVAIAVKTPVALVGQALMPILWVLVVGPALARAGAGSNDPDVDYYPYVAIGQIVFILPFSAMFAGLTVINDRNVGILRELLVSPIRRAMIPLASLAAVLTVAAGQIAIIVVLSVLRGAHFHLAVGPTLVALVAGGLLAGGTYALAEYLAYTLKQPQTFGTLIPLIGATPYLLCGALYPIATLPDGVREFSWSLPWSHAVALLRDGFIGSDSSHLDQIWHLQSQTAMVLLSLGVLAVFAGLMVALAMRAFRRATLA